MTSPDLKKFFPATSTDRVGANYWASHAGTSMWELWNEATVEKDLKLLSSKGIGILRVFPLWPDFQPLTQLYTAHVGRKQIALKPGTDPVSGVDPEMVKRLSRFCELAKKNDIQLILGIVTGWMSGRLFVPPALEGLNPITDPVSILWQTRLVRHLVNALRDNPAIVAWDLGNECNCMGASTREEAWVWTHAISSEIKRLDASRAVISGMHSLGLESPSVWRIQDQGELTDVLTTHPYPHFTPYCAQDGIGSLRTAFHATAETCLYSDVSGKPGFVEEMGTLGPNFADAKKASGFLRVNLWSALAHGNSPVHWWCAFDQEHLEKAPYEWTALERELGLFTSKHEAKPLVSEIHAYHQRVKENNLLSLPPRKRDAVCILSRGQDQWAVAYASFILAIQAGLDLRFVFADQPLPEAKLYLVPSLNGAEGLWRSEWIRLTERIQKGATLYLSLGSAQISGFESLTGLRMGSRKLRVNHAEFSGANASVKLNAGTRLELEAVSAKVLWKESDGNPAFAVASLGQGKVFTLAADLENVISHTPSSFEQGARDAWKIYQTFAEEILAEKSFRKVLGSGVGMTEHILSEKESLFLAINYSSEVTTFQCAFKSGWNVSQLNGKNATVELKTSPWEGKLEPQEMTLFRALKL